MKTNPNTKRHVTIRVELKDIYDAFEQFASLTTFLQFKAQDAVNILQETYGSGMAPTVSMVDYRIIGHEDNTILINVDFES